MDPEIMTARITFDQAAQEPFAKQLPALRAMLTHQRQLRMTQVAEFDAMLRALGADTDDGTAASHTRVDGAQHAIASKMANAAREALAAIDVALALLTDDPPARLSPNPGAVYRPGEVP